MPSLPDPRPLPSGEAAHAVEKLRGVLELQRERLRDEAVPRSLRQLLEMPPGRAWMAMGSSPRLRVRHPALELLSQARGLRFSAPCASLGAAWLAVAAAEAGGDVAAEKLDLQAGALGLGANALRILDRPDEALSVLRAAETCRRKGSGDPLLTLALRRYRAALYSDGGRYELALRILRQCAVAYSEMGHDHLLGYTLLSASRAVSALQGPEPAILYTWWALRRLDPRREPAVVATAIHNLGWFYLRQQRREKACDMLSLLGGVDTGKLGEWFGLSVRWLGLELDGRRGREEEFWHLHDAFRRLRRPRQVLGLKQALWEIRRDLSAEYEALENFHRARLVMAMLSWVRAQQQAEVSEAGAACRHGEAGR